MSRRRVDPVEQPDRRLERPDDEHERPGEHERRPLGPGQRDVLGHHLAEDDVREAHDDERDDEGDADAQALGDADGLERRTEEAVHGRLDHGEQQQRADRDAELASGEHERDVLHGAQHGLRASRALVARAARSCCAARR